MRSTPGQRDRRPPAAQAAPQPSGCTQQHRDRVYWYLRYLRCPHELSEDLTQETLQTSWQRREVADLASAAMDRWLRTTARNLYFMHLRREQRRPEVEDTALLEQVWREDVAADARQAALRDCLDALGGKARRALELHYVERKSRVEIARDLGMRENGVKSLLRRLRQSLKECTERRMR